MATEAHLMQEDTYRGDVMDIASLNLYTYCYNDPINFIDPSGHTGEYMGPPPSTWAEIEGSYCGETDDFFDYIDRSGRTEEYEEYIGGIGGRVDYMEYRTRVSAETAIYYYSNYINENGHMSFDEWLSGTAYINEKHKSYINEDAVVEAIYAFAMSSTSEATDNLLSSLYESRFDSDRELASKVFIYSEQMFIYELINNSEYAMGGWDDGLIDSDSKDLDKKYGENSTVYKAIMYLKDAWNLFPDYRADIEELANELRYLANTNGPVYIDIAIKALRKIGEMPENVNYVEQVLIVGYPIDAISMDSAREIADQATWQIFGESGNGDGEANAFKHSYWNAVATQKIGMKKTRLFANAHEFGWVWENASNPTPMKMDLHNNAVGRTIGASNLYEKDIRTGVLTELIKGGLYKVVNERLVRTNANAQFLSR